MRKFAATAAGIDEGAVLTSYRMAGNLAGACDVCGLPACVHVTTVDDGIARGQSLCIDHAPAEVRDAMPKTPDDEAGLLREKLALLDQSDMPADLKAQIRTHLEQTIDEIVSGRRRLSDLM